MKYRVGFHRWKLNERPLRCLLAWCLWSLALWLCKHEGWYMVEKHK